MGKTGKIHSRSSGSFCLLKRGSLNEGSFCFLYKINSRRTISNTGKMYNSMDKSGVCSTGTTPAIVFSDGSKRVESDGVNVKV